MKKITELFLTRLNPIAWWGVAIAAWAVSRVSQVWLDSFYDRSKFPVPFYVGQTTFDAAELKGYYAHMINEGTLGIYVQTQLVDFVFMAASFVFLLILAGTALRTLPAAIRESKFGNFAKAMLWVMPLAPVFDAIENLTSFVMLANPQDFAYWLVYPYSSFAVVKFALFGLGYLWALSSVFILMGYGLWTGVRKLFGGKGAQISVSVR
ncbi:hypothetical protein [Pelagicoccus mobilis]|uniref:Uncharacterized protein n=1 Tax=Pelagicoccus mobilis TaxID=415221 RepID=A0A934RXC8_9BACT|nr:hypothetical protein [Pelagicoccus mobilis]MBK1878291.1 hypothetical protein [Pelagicoccus mobilis]